MPIDTPQPPPNRRELLPEIVQLLRAHRDSETALFYSSSEQFRLIAAAAILAGDLPAAEDALTAAKIPDADWRAFARGEMDISPE